jgi:hypothetical protein
MREVFHDPAAAAARFEAWWSGRRLDRPPVSLAVGEPLARGRLLSHHVSARARWHDVGYQVDAAEAALARSVSIGDCPPVWVPPAGPDLVAALFGGVVDYEAEGVAVGAAAGGEWIDWEDFSRRSPDFGHECWRTVQATIAVAAERFAGRWMVAPPELRGNLDVVAALFGAAAVREAIDENPAAVQRAARHAGRALVEVQRRIAEQLRGLGQRVLPWCGSDGRQRAGVVGCHNLAGLAVEEARRWVVPVLAFEVAAWEWPVFAFEGGGSLAHLDLVLGLPGLRAVRFAPATPEAAAGGWLAAFRRVRAAGRSLHVVARDGPDALAVLDELGPEGLWLSVRRPFLNVDRAAQFLDSVHALAR